MASQVSAKCFVEQETGFLVDEAGNKLQEKSMVMCLLTPFVMTEETDMDHFAGDKLDNIFHADERYFNFLEDQAKELKAEKNQSILASMFRALTGSRHRTKRKQVTGILSMPLTSESIPVSDLEAITVVTPPGPSKVE